MIHAVLPLPRPTLCANVESRRTREGTLHILNIRVAMAKDGVGYDPPRLLGSVAARYGRY